MSATRGLGAIAKVVGDKRMSFIGGGKMCEAIVRGLTGNPDVSTDNFLVVDPHQGRRNIFTDINVSSIPAIDTSVCDSDVVMLSVKPQHAPEILSELQGRLKPHTLVMSIMAGIPIDQLGGLGTENVVRTMPNTPALIKQGMSVWYPTPSVTASIELMSLTRSILQSIGEEIEVKQEYLMDCATAISGTGPAYFLMLMEAMVDTGVHMGFSRDASIKLVQQTALGTAMLPSESTTISPTSHRRNITSPAGTTAAAMYALDRGNFRTCVHDAIWMAYRRSLELGGKDSNVGPGRHM